MAKNWTFSEYGEHDTRKNSSSAKHFGNQSRSESLVRESVQNSVDAREKNTNQPAEIRISFRTIPYKQCKEYLEDLNSHLKACDDPDIANLDGTDEIRFLILEDFNTTGLERDKAKHFLSQENIKTHDRDKRSGGSHGIGKVAVCEASTIKTMFVFSVFTGGEEAIFTGKSCLITHTLDETEYREDGWLNLDSHADHEFKILLFERKKEKGLSIAIPFHHDEIKKEELKEVVIKECYYPIIKQRLVVTLDGTKIDANFILNGKNDSKTELISDYITKSEKPNLTVEIGTQYQKHERKLELTDDQKNTVIESLEKGSVFIRFNFQIQKKNKNAIGGFLDFLIAKKKEEAKRKGKFDFWRENVLVTEASKRRNPSSEYTIIVLAEGQNNELSILLKELENPSHTRWEHQKPPPEIKQNYKYVSPLITFITRLPNEMIKSLKSQPFTENPNFFSDLFPAGFKSGGAGKTTETVEKRPGLDPVFYHRPNRKDNGFIISLRQDIDEIPDKVSIEVAYGTNSGDPFKHHNERDFDFHTNIKITIENGKRELVKRNTIICKINSKDFKATLSGFDLVDRELKYNITTLD